MPKKTTEQLEKEMQAFEFGKKAFHSGIKCSPALDPDFMIPSNCGPIDNELVLKAWVKGWATENLKEDNYAFGDTKVSKKSGWIQVAKEKTNRYVRKFRGRIPLPVKAPSVMRDEKKEELKNKCRKPIEFDTEEEGGDFDEYAKSEQKWLKVSQNNNISISNNVFDWHSGELFAAVIAHNQEGKKVGYIDYSEYNNIVAIKYIFVNPEYRRQGIATRMKEFLQNEFPKDKIENFGSGILTPDGESFEYALNKIKGKDI